MRLPHLGLVLALSCALVATALAQECSEVQAQLAESQASYKGLYATWVKSAHEADVLRDQVSTLQGEIDTLQATLQLMRTQLQKASKQQAVADDWPSLLTAIAGRTQKSFAGAVEEVKAIAQELQHGKTNRLMGALGDLTAAFRGAASCTVAFVSAQADKHLPDSVKKQISEVVALLQKEWKEHVSNAAWAQPVLSKVESVVAEVQSVVSHTLKASPALAPLADPVTVQLVVYAVFALPLLLLLVLPFALCLGRRTSKQTVTTIRPPGAKKAKKNASGKRA